MLYTCERYKVLVAQPGRPASWLPIHIANLQNTIHTRGRYIARGIQGARGAATGAIAWTTGNADGTSRTVYRVPPHGPRRLIQSTTFTILYTRHGGHKVGRAGRPLHFSARPIQGQRVTAPYNGVSRTIGRYRAAEGVAWTTPSQQNRPRRRTA